MSDEQKIYAMLLGHALSGMLANGFEPRTRDGESSQQGRVRNAALYAGLAMDCVKRYNPPRAEGMDSRLKDIEL